MLRWVSHVLEVGQLLKDVHVQQWRLKLGPWIVTTLAAEPRLRYQLEIRGARHVRPRGLHEVETPLGPCFCLWPGQTGHTVRCRSSSTSSWGNACFPSQGRGRLSGRRGLRDTEPESGARIRMVNTSVPCRGLGDSARAKSRVAHTNYGNPLYGCAERVWCLLSALVAAPP